MKYLKFFPFYLLSLLPLSFLYVISDCLFFILYYLIGYRRKIVRSNLKNSFPNKTIEERNRIEKEFYKHFSDVAFETIKKLTITKKGVLKRVKVKNTDLITELFNKKKNIILYASHYANWEWLTCLEFYTPYKTQTFYKKISSSYFNDFMLLMRSRFGVTCIESRLGYKTLVATQQQQNGLTLTCLIGDQSPLRKSTKEWVTFLNQETAFLAGADRIAKKLNYAVIVPVFHKYGRGKYEIDFSLITTNAREMESEDIIKAYAKTLEEAIIKQPELWLWTHRRWKLTKANSVF